MGATVRILFLRKRFSIGRGLGAMIRKVGLQVGWSLDSLLQEMVFYWKGVGGFFKKRTKGLHSPFLKGHLVWLRCSPFQKDFLLFDSLCSTSNFQKD